MDLPCPPPLLAGAMLLGIAPAAAFGQTDSVAARGYPCASGGELTIVQGDGGFSIAKKVARTEPVASPEVVRLGSSLTLDSRIFARTSLIPESSHVPQR